MLRDIGDKINAAFASVLQKPSITDNELECAFRQFTDALLAADVSPDIAKGLISRLREEIRGAPRNTNRKSLVKKLVFDGLVRLLQTGAPVELEAPAEGLSQVVVFVGLQGAGKTTTCAKYARHMKKSGYRPVVVCADTFRAGAYDQLRQNAHKAGIDFFGDEKETDPVAIAKRALSLQGKYDLLIIDTSGRNIQDKDLILELSNIVRAVNPKKIMLVLDASGGQSAQDQAIGFDRAVHIDGVIITKIDGTAKAGGALSGIAHIKKPVEFIGTGEHFDEFDRFSAQKFVGAMFGQSDVEGLFSKLKELRIDENSIKEILTTGNFSLYELREQIKNIMQLGPLKNLAKFIPQLKFIGDFDSNIFSNIFYACDSMTMKELKSNGDLIRKSRSRILRIAQGSGQKEETVRQILEMHAEFSKIFKTMKDNGFIDKLLKLDSSENPNDDMNGMISSIMNMLPPALKKKLDPSIQSLAANGGNIGSVFEDEDEDLD